MNSSASQTHPLLLIRGDQYLEKIISKLNWLLRYKDTSIFFNSREYYERNFSLYKDDNSEFDDLFRTILFRNFNDLKLRRTNFMGGAACGKTIIQGEVFFTCYDCDTCPPGYHACLCLECFDKSDHKGHRLQKLHNTISKTPTCDCGDSANFKPEGFCSKHRSKPFDIKDLYEKFPQEIREKYEMIIKKVIYAVVSLAELNQQEKYDKILQFSDNVLGCLLDFLTKCHTETNKAFLIILCKTLQGQFESSCDLVFHDCQNLTNNLSKEPHQCTCSLLGNLLRIGYLLGKETQKKLNKLLVDCFGVQDFLEFQAIELTKYIQFLCGQDFTQGGLKESEDQGSILLSLFSHAYLQDSVRMKVMDSGYFDNLLNLIKKAVCTPKMVNVKVSKTIEKIGNIFDYCLTPQSQSAQRVLKDENFMLQYLEMIMTYQMKFHYPGNLNVNLKHEQIMYDSLNVTLVGENQLCAPFLNYIKQIYDLPLDERGKSLSLLVKTWHKNLQNAKAALKGQVQSFDPSLERLFCFMTANHMKEDISRENLQNYLIQNLSFKVKQNYQYQLQLQYHEFAKSIIEGPLRALGMIRYLHLTFSFKLAQSIYIYYFIDGTPFFEMDIVTTQMMIMMIQKPEKGLFGLLVENFFSYCAEIQHFFQDPNEKKFSNKKLLTVIEDFLNLLVFLMTDESCLVNMQTGKNERTPRQREVVKNFLINFMKGYYWTTHHQMKALLTAGFSFAGEEVDKILSEITIKDEKDVKIRIKDEYEGDNIDPYMLYRMPSIRQEIVQNFLNKHSQTPVDAVSGHYDKNSPLHLKEIQRNLYQSDLPEFLAKYLKTVDIKASPALIQAVLRLVLLNFQVYEQSDDLLLKQKVEKNFLNENFAEILKKISTEESLKDCKICVENIQDYLQMYGPISSDDEEAPKSKNLNDKKRLMEERMAKVKQDFAQKQALFAQKNQQDLKTDPAKKVEKGDHFVCQHCMEDLNASNEDYGFLVFINFTNNFYDKTDTTPFMEQDWSDFSKAQWWPVISSCNHYYHRKCYEIFSQTHKGIEFCLDKYETFCPLCKGLCNNFLSMKPLSSDKKKNALDKNRVFIEKIQNIFSSLKARIQLVPSKNASAVLPLELVFERAHQYLIESFETQTTPESFKKTFELYLAFFKAFKSNFADIDFKIPVEKTKPYALFKNASYPTEILAKSLQKKISGATADSSPKMMMKSQEISLLKTLVLLKIIQNIAMNNSSPNVNIKNCFTLYQSNQTIQSSVLEQLLLPIQKLVLASAFNFSVDSAKINLPELCHLLLDANNLNKEAYFTSLFKAINLPCSFPQLVTEIFHELPSRPETDLNFLQSLFNEKIFNKESLKPLAIKWSSRIIEIPETVLDFNTRYLAKKCSLCNCHPAQSCVCLICGEVFCALFCPGHMDKPGNLNRHAKKYHMGMSFFLDTQSLDHNIVNAQFHMSMVKLGLYVDDLGQELRLLFKLFPTEKIKELDWKKFKLKSENFKQIKEIIEHQTIRQHLFAMNMKCRENPLENLAMVLIFDK